MTAVIHKPISPLKITWPLLPDDFILPDDPVDNRHLAEIFES
ncbi:MAG: hypothetical protein ABI180_17915 [Microcoleus sp.]